MFNDYDITNLHSIFRKQNAYLLELCPKKLTPKMFLENMKRKKNFWIINSWSCFTRNRDKYLIILLHNLGRKKREYCKHLTIRTDYYKFKYVLYDGMSTFYLHVNNHNRLHKKNIHIRIIRMYENWDLLAMKRHDEIVMKEHYLLIGLCNGLAVTYTARC